MADFHEPKIANTCVANPDNNSAIGGDCRLSPGYFESQANSPRINQHFPTRRRRIYEQW